MKSRTIRPWLCGVPTNELVGYSRSSLWDPAHQNTASLTLRVSLSKLPSPHIPEIDKASAWA
jgi:hypothetical protein